jgi:hypothetical protein
MKLSVILCFLGMLQVSASVYSQKSKFSFSYKDQSVKEVLNDIEKNSEDRKSTRLNSSHSVFRDLSRMPSSA